MDDTQIKVRRVLEYTGSADWIVRTLGRSIGIGRPLRMGNGGVASHAEGDLAQLKAWLFERSVVTP